MQLLNHTMSRCLSPSSCWRQLPAAAAAWDLSRRSSRAVVSLPPQQQLLQARQRSDVSVAAADPATYQNGYGPPAPEEAGSGSVPVFVSWNVYKGKGAVSTKVIRPTWVNVGQGGGARVRRDGVLFLEFAKAIEGQQRAYDWNNKVTWGMSVPELSTILATPNQQHDFFHDPAKGRAEEGQVTKSMRWSPAPQGNGYFINVTENNKPANFQRKVDVSLTPGEFYTFKRLADFCIPYLLGFDAAFGYDG